MAIVAALAAVALQTFRRSEVSRVALSPAAAALPPHRLSVLSSLSPSAAA